MLTQAYTRLSQWSTGSLMASIVEVLGFFYQSHTEDLKIVSQSPLQSMQHIDNKDMTI